MKELRNIIDKENLENDRKKLKVMHCDICGLEVEPLDAHMGRINGKLLATHIGCWNKLRGNK